MSMNRNDSVFKSTSYYHQRFPVNCQLESERCPFLAEEGMLEACEEQAIKELVAEQITRAMQEQGLTRTAMAARMRTSRAALNRLLDPTNPSVTLQTLQKAAQVIGKRLRLELVDAAK
jgi:ribosome-binding protein aMBF1 (putative translation factor)